jgi:hypothetical protein
MQHARSSRSKSPRQLDREIAHALAKKPAHAAGGLSWQGRHVPIDQSPRTIKPFELDRPYVVRQHKRLYTIVNDTELGYVAHPAKVAGKSTKHGAAKRVSHATKARDKTSDKINIDQLAKMFGLPDWEKIDEMNQDHYWEMSRGAADEEAEMDAQQAAAEEVYGQWYDAVERASSKLFEEHGLELTPTGKQGSPTRRYDFKIVPQNSWDDAANKIRETINGVGDFHFDSLKEFLHREGPTARKAALSHLGYIKKYPLVYGGLGAHQMYEQAWR